MFTGIVTDVGYVREIEKRGDLNIIIETKYQTKGIKKGASICCSGACLTVVEKGSDWFSVDVSQASLDATILRNWLIGTPINLERSLMIGEELGGHIVTGHVDGIAEVVEIKKEGDSRRVLIKCPKPLQHFIASKGSVTLNGISLTINEVNQNVFNVNIIPHTWENTTFENSFEGSLLNIEVDIIARYVARLMQSKG